MASLRLSELCKCGCAGDCSIRPRLAMIQWSLQALADKLYPLTRHDNSAWAVDDHRAAKGGSPLEVVAALVNITGDWEGWCEVFSVPTWADVGRPCLCCGCDRASLYTYAGLTPLNSPWPETSFEGWESACDACERRVALSQEQHRAVRNALFNDRRKDGNKGRCLSRDFPLLGLQKGDRLEPSDELPDTSLFDAPVGFPVVCRFWRRSRETIARHRCALFSQELGITLAIFIIDTLHCLNLGVLQHFADYGFRALFDANVYELGETTIEARMVTFCLRIKSDLHDWYRQREHELDPEDRSRLTDFVPSMLGTADQPLCKTKGAETKPLIWFLLAMFRRFVARVRNARYWIRAAEALKNFMVLLKQSGPVMNVATAQEPLGKQ